LITDFFVSAGAPELAAPVVSGKIPETINDKMQEKVVREEGMYLLVMISLL
jgi:hypothetical protein